MGGETVHPADTSVIQPLRAEWVPSIFSATPSALKSSVLLLITLLNILMNRAYWCSPGNRRFFPLFTRYGFENTYFERARTGQINGFAGLAYTCHGSLLFLPVWLRLCVAKKNWRLSPYH